MSKGGNPTSKASSPTTWLSETEEPFEIEGEDVSKESPASQAGRSDRRIKQTNPFSLRSILHGRRRLIRRTQDRQYHYYVDRYGIGSAALFVICLLFSTLDAIVTIRLIHAGGEELNPLMLFVLQLGEMTFLAVKFSLTTFALLFLLVHKEYQFLGGRLRGKHLLGFALFLYAVLILWEVILLYRL